jgi:SAM-dependent methyltransferase
MSDSIAGKEKLTQYYEGLLEKYGDDYRALDWKSKESQEIRFYVLLDVISYISEHKTISILDVGCGIGHFYDFIKGNGFLEKLNIKYTGIDISKKSIEFAKKKHPDVEFKAVDLIHDKFEREFDVVIASGAFNIRMTDVDVHKESIRQMLSRMFKMSRSALAVNFLGRPALYLMEPDMDTQEDKFVYFPEEETISWVRSLADRYVLRRDYHPGDFTVYMLK